MAPAGAPPSITEMVVASMLSILASLAADAVLVKLGVSLFPSIRSYSHFRFSDYGTLTIIGVAAACAAWPVAIRITSAPRRLFIRLAMIMTLALWFPDLYLLVKHEPIKAVAVLMAMHVAIAVITYNLLVRLAAPRSRETVAQENATAHASDSVQLTATEPASAPDEARAAPRVPRYAWIVMTSAVCAEFGAGVAALLLVPFARPSEWISPRGEAVYLFHAILGGALGLGAFAVLVRALGDGRLARIGALIGLAGISLGAGGGVLAVYHRFRLLGLALMFVGAVVALFGYATPIIESPPNEGPGPANRL